MREGSLSEVYELPLQFTIFSLFSMFKHILGLLFNINGSEVISTRIHCSCANRAVLLTLFLCTDGKAVNTVILSENMIIFYMHCYYPHSAEFCSLFCFSSNVFVVSMVRYCTQTSLDLSAVWSPLRIWEIKYRMVALRYFQRITAALPLFPFNNMR